MNMDANILNSYSFFGQFKSNILKDLAKAARKTIVPENHTIIHEEERATSLYLIIRGTLAISKNQKTGHAEVISQIKEGEAFGRSLLTLENEHASFKSLAPTTLCYWQLKDLQRLFKKYPKLKKQLIISLSKVS